MTIRNKTLLIVGLTLSGLLVAIYFVSTWILTANLASLEKQDTNESVGRVRDALAQTLDSMNTTTTSWAQWDATCTFLRDRNRAYFNENLTPSTLTTMKSNVVIFVNETDHIVFGTNHDLKTVKNLPLDPEVRALIKPDNPLLRHISANSYHSGILLTPSHVLLVVTRPIVNNNGTGTIHGTLLTGIYLTAAQVKKLADLTHLPISLQRLNAPGLPPDFQRARQELASRALASSAATWVQPLNEDVVAGYALLPSIFGEPALLLRVDAQRDILKQGQLGTRNLIVALLVSGLVFGITTLLLLERLVVSRLTQLSEDVNTISSAGDFSRQVSVGGQDELSRLSVNINGLTRALHTSLREEASNRAKIETSLHEKDVLLKEVYHRVKNNLQIISSLLNLQSDATSEPAVREMFSECRNRVRSMALVHEKLYRSSDLSHIHFGEYLDNLATTLLRSYDHKGGPITLALETDDALLSIDLAVPCGLIINELITNTVKYAFPHGQGGTIRIGFCTLEDGVFALSVADNGVGIPHDFEIEDAESIGMQLVIGLTEQLEGSYELLRDHGTQWTITFRGR